MYHLYIYVYRKQDQEMFRKSGKIMPNFLKILRKKYKERKMMRDDVVCRIGEKILINTSIH